MLAGIGGKPMVRHVVEAGLASRAKGVIVVTGHEAGALRAALQGLRVSFVHNADYAKGLSASLRVGVASVPADVDAALVLLGDMPFVTPQLIDGLHAALEAHASADIAVPVFGGRRGNPVLWRRSLFDRMLRVEGDVGARALMLEHKEDVVELPVADAAVLTDIDTPAALAQHRDKGGR